nr:shikimate O-hydroxycinnamoyltransferase-like [Ipomoea batatas]
MAYYNSNFKVSVTKKEVVAAARPLQEHCLPHSNLDLLFPPVDVGVFLCYQKPAAASDQTTTDEHYATFGSVVNTLKAALFEALVSFYALAGEVEQNLAGEPELICNNRGVDFVQAFADVELRKLNLYNPDDSVEGKLVHKKKHGVLAIQATELKCGGIVVACTFDHRVGDAYSTNMFLVSWSEIAQAKQPSQLPCFRRSLLFPRRPGHYDLFVANMYIPISSLLPPEPGVEESLISRIYCVTAEQIRHLQSQANDYSDKDSADKLKHPRCTKVEAFCAFLWKTVALGKSRRNFKNFRLGIVVDEKTSLSSGDQNKGKCFEGYFGNVLSIPFGQKRIEELRENPLAWVASAVHEFLEEAMTSEHFLGLIDWVESHRPEPAVAKVCARSGDGAAVVVSSGQRFPVRQIDFGWGKPAFGSYHFPRGGQSGYVMPMPSPKGNGDWIVYMLLEKEQVALIETYDSHVFKPFTSDHLNFN